MTKQKRKNTKLESEGAEFLVLGKLLLEKIPIFKTYTNYPGYDLNAVNPDFNSSCRIQVKSRYRTDWDGFIIKNLDCDFVVLVLLNRGFSTSRKSGDRGIKEPEFFVLPVAYVKKAQNPKSKWGKVAKSRLKGIEDYQNRWDLIEQFLKK